MHCIFNYCKEDLSGDLFVVAYYATLVLVTLGLSLRARSRSLRAAAVLIAAAWIVNLFFYFFLMPPGHYLAGVLINAMLAFRFWRMAKTQLFPAALCLIQFAHILVVLIAVPAGFSTYWTLFILNRLFELTLAYLIGCSMFRIHSLGRRRQNGEATGKGWRARFVAG